MTWNDGNPVTADDWVATFQYGADPEHAWDFTWFFQGMIKGWDDAIAGKVAARHSSACARARANTNWSSRPQVPAPYLPAMLLYSLPLSTAALAEHGSGPLYNTKPETSVSCGPFMLTEWTAAAADRLHEEPEVQRHDEA